MKQTSPIAEYAKKKRGSISTDGPPFFRGQTGIGLHDLLTSQRLVRKVLQCAVLPSARSDNA
jgi:hypothetical protein